MTGDWKEAKTHLPPTELKFVKAQARKEDVSMSAWLRALVEHAHKEWIREQILWKKERHERRRKA